MSKEITMILNVEMTHVHKLTDAELTEVLNETGGYEGWKKYITGKIQNYLMDDFALDLDDAKIKNVQLHEREVPDAEGTDRAKIVNDLFDEDGGEIAPKEESHENH